MNAQPVRSVILLSMQMYADTTVRGSERRRTYRCCRRPFELIFGQFADTQMSHETLSRR
jgi:hypothetical protein